MSMHINGTTKTSNDLALNSSKLLTTSDTPSTKHMRISQLLSPVTSTSTTTLIAPPTSIFSTTSLPHHMTSIQPMPCLTHQRPYHLRSTNQTRAILIISSSLRTSRHSRLQRTCYLLSLKTTHRVITIPSYLPSRLTFINAKSSISTSMRHQHTLHYRLSLYITKKDATLITLTMTITNGLHLVKPSLTLMIFQTPDTYSLTFSLPMKTRKLSKTMSKTSTTPLTNFKAK